MNRLSLAAALFSAALRTFSAGAQTPPAGPAALTRNQAVALALRENPQIAVARAQLDEARAQMVQLTAFPDPQFYFDAEQETSIWAPRSAAARDIGGTLTLPFPDKFRLNKKIGEGGIRAAQANLRLLRQQVASQTVQAYDALLVALRHHDDLTGARDLAGDFLRKTEARFEAGTAARLDVLTARVSLAQASNDLIGNERTVATARAALDRLLGRATGIPVEPAGALAEPPPLPALPDALALAAENRPEIRSVMAQQDAARSQTKLNRQFWLPDLSLTLSRNLTAGSPPAYSTILGFDVPLLFWQHTRGEVAQARSREAELAATLSDTRAQVALDVRTSWAAADTAIRQVRFLEHDLVAAAREQYRIASESYALGGSSALDVIQAKQALVSAQIQLTDALGAANDAVADLERAVGGTLPASATRGDDHVR